MSSLNHISQHSAIHYGLEYSCWLSYYFSFCVGCICFYCCFWCFFINTSRPGLISCLFVLWMTIIREFLECRKPADYLFQSPSQRRSRLGAIHIIHFYISFQLKSLWFNIMLVFNDYLSLYSYQYNEKINKPINCL